MWQAGPWVRPCLDAPVMCINEEVIDMVNLRHLGSSSLWPITRPLAPNLVEEIELGRYMRRLLATHCWSGVRVVPQPDPQNSPSKHVFDVYGHPVDPDAQGSA